jgi:hypothetical protein
MPFCNSSIGNGLGLTYSKESGALNESLSDIWSACVEQWGTTGKHTWLLGEDVIPGGGRSMSNPNVHGQPDTYQGTNWVNTECGTPSDENDQCGIHTNSGVGNFWFFLLSQGGTGTNDLQNAYDVRGIGMTNAARIVYLMETAYLFATAGYYDARSASITAATNLFGTNSCEVINVTNAWHAVGVGAPFQYSNVTITGPSIVCSTGANFNVNNPPNTTITWTTSSNIIIENGQTTSSLDVKASGGSNPDLTLLNTTENENSIETPLLIIPPAEQPGNSGWIDVTLTNPCGNSITLPRKTVWSGLPGFKPVVTGPTEIQCGVYNMYFEQNYRAIYWSVPSSMQIIGPAGPGHKCTIKGLEFAAAGVIGTVSNECGSFTNILPVMITCGYLAVSPNPASSEIDVSILSTNEDKSVSQPVISDKPYVVNIYNTYGTKVLSTQKNTGSFKLSVSNLVNGTYFLEVSDGKNTYKNQLTIKH